MFHRNWDSLAHKVTQAKEKCMGYKENDPHSAELLNQWRKELETARSYVQIEASKSTTTREDTARKNQFLNDISKELEHHARTQPHNEHSLASFVFLNNLRNLG